MSALSYPTGDNTAGATGPAGPAGPAGNPYLQATTDSALSDGAAVKRVSGGHFSLGSGGTSGSSAGVVGVAHPAALISTTANVYPSGTRAPVAGLPVGYVYRSNAGALVAYGSLVPTEFSQCMGFSDGAGVDVLVGEEFLV
jgi:hypothetical protein